MRIIAGRFKGFRLPSPKARGVRPTTDRVREALFSILAPELAGADVLELFAGTGAFGFEALSRGAGSVTFVEKDRAVAEDLSKTVKTLGVRAEVVVLAMDAAKAVRYLLTSEKRFEMVFMDPPYGTQWISKITSIPGFCRLVETDGLLVVESDSAIQEDEIPACFDKFFCRRYGTTFVEIFRHGSSCVTDHLLRGKVGNG